MHIGSDSCSFCINASSERNADVIRFNCLYEQIQGESDGERDGEGGVGRQRVVIYTRLIATAFCLSSLH